MPHRSVLGIERPPGQKSGNYLSAIIRKIAFSEVYIIKCLGVALISDNPNPTKNTAKPPHRGMVKDRVLIRFTDVL